MKNNIISKSQYKKQKKGFSREVLEWGYVVLGTIIITLFILGNVFSITGIDGESMEPTFHHGERIIDYKLGYRFSGPKPGDIVILNKYESKNGIISNMIEQGKDIINNISNRINNEVEVKYIIKRVIAVPGDTLDIEDGYVYINGNKLEEDYIKGRTYERSEISYPVVIPENQVFVLGDNRDNSLDSRQLGLIDFEQIKGKVTFRIWPIGRFGKVE